MQISSTLFSISELPFFFLFSYLLFSFSNFCVFRRKVANTKIGIFSEWCNEMNADLFLKLLLLFLKRHLSESYTLKKED